jgi:endo-1,4-beta-xylanase
VFQRFIGEIAARGLKIIITELDVFDGDSPADPAERDREVAAMYADYLAIALEPPQTLGVVTWGLSDRYSWITSGTEDRFKRVDGFSSRPLPLDADLRPTPCYAALAAALDKAPRR